MIYLGKNYIYLKMVEIKVGGEVFSFKRCIVDFFLFWIWVKIFVYYSIIKYFLKINFNNFDCEIYL